MMIFMNFAHTFSSTPTPPAAALIIQTALTSLTNDDFLYIKFPDPSLFNGDCNKYLVWKQKIFDKLLAKNQKYVKMGI